MAWLKNTGPDGKADFALEPGIYAYSVSKAGMGTVEGSFTVEDADVNVTATLQTLYTVTFEVENTDAELVIGATCSAGGKSAATVSTGKAVISLPRGIYAYTVTHPDYRPLSGTFATAVPEIQTLFLDTPSAGTFKLGDGTYWTDDIAYNADAATIQAALEELYGEDNVTVENDTDFTITFDVSVETSNLEADFTSLVDAAGASLAIDQEYEGSNVTVDHTDATGTPMSSQQEIIFNIEDDEENPVEGVLCVVGTVYYPVFYGFSEETPTLSSTDPGFKYAYTNAAGRARIPVGDGEYDYSIEHSLYRRVVGTVTLADGESETINQDIGAELVLEDGWTWPSPDFFNNLATLTYADDNRNIQVANTFNLQSMAENIRIAKIEIYTKYSVPYRVYIGGQPREGSSATIGQEIVIQGIADSVVEFIPDMLSTYGSYGRRGYLRTGRLKYFKIQVYPYISSFRRQTYYYDIVGQGEPNLHEDLQFISAYVPTGIGSSDPFYVSEKGAPPIKIYFTSVADWEPATS